MTCKVLTFLLSVNDDLCPNQDPDSIMIHIKDVLNRKLLVNQCFEAPMDGGLFVVLQSVNHPSASNISIFIRRYISSNIHTINIEAAVKKGTQLNRK